MRVKSGSWACGKGENSGSVMVGDVGDLPVPTADSLPEKSKIKGYACHQYPIPKASE